MLGLSDSFYIPGALIFVTTLRCNFACKHCLRSLSQPKDLPLDILEKAAIGAKPFNFKIATLTGGEPLIYPYFKDAIEILVRHGYKFAMTTNGFTFKDHLPFFRQHKKNIGFIAFSIESSDETKHDLVRHPGSFKRLLEDFRLCKEAGIPFRIITTASNANFDEIFDIAVLAKKKGAQALVMTTVLPCPRGEEGQMILSPEKRQELFYMLQQMQKTLRFNIFIGADIRASTNIKLCNPMNLREITVDVDGNLTMCCELANHDDERVRENAIVASLKDSSFEDALKKFSEYLHKFSCMRLDDYKKQTDVDHIDFNSCFYCIRRLAQQERHTLA